MAEIWKDCRFTFTSLEAKYSAKVNMFKMYIYKNIIQSYSIKAQNVKILLLKG